MAFKINPDLQMDSFRNWHGIHMLQFHNHIEGVLKEQYGNDTVYTLPDNASDKPQFISRMHHYLVSLFLINTAEAVISLNKPGLFGGMSPKYVAKMTDMNTNIRSVYGEDFFKEYCYLSDQGKKSKKINDYVVAQKFCEGAQIPEDTLDPYEDPIETIARSIVNTRQIHIDPYATWAIGQLESVKA